MAAKTEATQLRGRKRGRDRERGGGGELTMITVIHIIWRECLNTKEH